MVSKVTVLLSTALVGLPLLAGPRLLKVEVDTMDTATVPANGTLRIEGGLGDLNLETWDGPNVQISVARFRYADAADKAAYEKDLKAIAVSVKQENDAAVITTSFPHREFWVKLLKGKTEAGMEYRIQVPRGTNVVVDHGDGAVVVMDTGGNLDVKAEHGDIVALLPAAGDAAIDAHTAWGRVDSDFDGDFHHKHVLGETYAGKEKSGRTVKLRLKCGDITIQRAVAFKYS